MEMVFGKHSVRAVFQARPGAVRRTIVMDGPSRYLGEFLDASHRAGVKPEVLSREEFQRLGRFTEEDKHQGILVFADPRDVGDEHDLDRLADARAVLALDQLSNPQNFGTILRNAAFFGIDAVLWMKNRAVDLSPTVTRVAVGGAELVDLFRLTNLARSLETLKNLGFWVYGLDERGEKTLAETDFGAKAVLVVGAEGEGLRQRTKATCDALVRIPGGRPGLESLNAGVACGIALAELTRARGERPG